MSDFTLHDFSFETPERRQEVAAGHHLWPAFEDWMAGRGYDTPVSMDSEKMRELYECFIEGACQEFNQYLKAHGLPPENSADLLRQLTPP